MRFVFGIIIGGLATLLAASAMEIPADTFKQSTQDIWASLQSARAAPLKDIGQATVQPTAMEQASPHPLNLEANAKPLIAANAEPDPTHAELNPPKETIAESITPGPTTSPSQDKAPQASTSAEALDTARLTGQATVWSPFHSEASASGFARRLSEQLDHPFYVVRSGPANYQVTYSFSDPEQQTLLQAGIAAVTGADVP